MTIYQVLTRLFGNDLTARIPGGTKEENGCGTLAHFSEKALCEIRSLGATHVWFTGLIEHATQTDYSAWGIGTDSPRVVKGKAGSPYAIKDYYDVDPDLATSVPQRMKELESLIRRTHKAGLGFIMDFVPNHVARQYHSDAAPGGTEDLGEGDDTGQAFSPQNNFYYLPGEPLHLDNITGSKAPYSEMPARVTGNDCFSAWPGANDWYETVKLNYGIDYRDGGRHHFSPRPSTWEKMLDILLFWAAKGIDAFRCDMAEMVPVEFWEWAIGKVKESHPDILFIAEVYNPALYRDYVHRGGFDYLYDKVGLYDALRAVTRHEASAQCLTRCWQQVDDIRSHMLHFLENHDEQRLASEFFAGDARRGRAPLLVSALMDNCPMMIYFGQELGERGMDAEGYSGCDGRTTIYDYWTIDTISRWRDGGTFSGKKLTGDEKRLREFYARVLALRESMPVLRAGRFYDLMYANPHLHRQYVFARQLEHEVLLVIANFDEQEAHVSVNLPLEFFRFMGVEGQANVRARDLLGEADTQVDFTPGKPLSTDVRRWNGVMLSIRL
ncbi:MAG: alpha-amylase family protein [Bacteroidaceae bacterium]